MPSSSPVTPINLYSPLKLCTSQMQHHTTHQSHSTPSYIQKAPLTTKLHTIHSPAGKGLTIPLNQQYFPSDSIPSKFQSAPLTMQITIRNQMQYNVSHFLSHTHLSIPF